MALFALQCGPHCPAHGLTRFCLGEGRNGIVRYSRKEVEAFEAQRQVPAEA